MTDEMEPELVHRFHAETNAFSGELISPLPQVIPPHAFAKIKPEGGYLAQHSLDFQLEHIFSYKSAHTQVSGRVEAKSGAYATLATSVVEGLNILEVITADRIVSQVSTVHYPDQDTPSISFLGTRFDNLRVGGVPLELHLDLGLLGSRPDGDVHYHDHPDFLSRMEARQDSLYRAGALPSTDLRYTHSPVTEGGATRMEFSLVRESFITKTGMPIGQFVEIENFGTIHLATVEFHRERQRGKEKPATTIELTMIKAKLGCLVDGNCNVAAAKTNGGKGPPNGTG